MASFYCIVVVLLLPNLLLQLGVSVNCKLQLFVFLEQLLHLVLVLLLQLLQIGFSEQCLLLQSLGLDNQLLHFPFFFIQFGLALFHLLYILLLQFSQTLNQLLVLVFVVIETVADYRQ